MPEDPRDRSLPAWAQAADAVALVLAAVAVYVFVDGGFRIKLAGIKVSLLDPWRPALAALAVLALRHGVHRHRALPLRLWAVLAWAARLAVVAARRLARIPIENDVERFGEAAPGPAVAARARQNPAIRFAVVFFLFWLLTLAMTYPQVTSMLTVRDAGDPYFSAWRLSWIAHQLPRDPLHLFDGNIFYPERATLAYSDSMILPGLIGAPFLWAGMHQLALSNLAVVATFVLSAMVMFNLVRSLTGSALAGFASGAMFAFYPFRFDHYSHLELLMTMWMPLAAWCLHALVARPTLRRGAALGVAVTAQALSSIYYALFLVPWLGVAWITMAVRARRFRVTLTPLLVGAVVAALLLLPVMWPYFTTRSTVGERDLSAIAYYSGQVSNYLGATRDSVLWGDVLSAFRQPERALFPGVLIVMLAVAGAWPPLSIVRLAYLLGLAFAFDASLGLNGLTYPLLHDYVLPFRGLRVPARFAMLVGFSLAVLAGYGVARIERRFARTSARLAVVAVLVAVVLVEDYPALRFQPAPAQPPHAYAYFAGQPTAVIAELPGPENEEAYWKEAIREYYATFHWMTLVNGNSGFFPKSYRVFLQETRGFPDDRSLALLRSRSVSFVVVHEDGYGSPRFHDVVDAADRRPDLHEVARSSGSKPGQDVRIYRLQQ